MRKIIFTVLLLVLFLTSCGAPETLVFSCGEFTSQVKAEKGDFVFSGELRYFSPRNMTLTVTQPENLGGCILTRQGEKISLIKGETVIELNSSLSTTADKNVYENLFEALAALGGQTFEILSGSEQIEGNYLFGIYKAVIDVENRKPKLIETGSYKYIFS